MLLREEQHLFLAVLGPPLTNSSLQRPELRIAQPPRVAALQLLEYRHRHQLRLGLQHRHDLADPHLGQRIRSCTPMAFRALRRQAVAPLQAPGTGYADTNFCSRCLLAVSHAQFLVLGHLMIRDAFAGHGPPPYRGNHCKTPTTSRVPTVRVNRST
jgi:hypothetical protein